MEMPTKIECFADYDAAKAMREHQEDTLVESKLEFLLNLHPAVKQIRSNAQQVRKKAVRNAGIILLGHFFQSSTSLLEQIEEVEKDYIGRCREEFGAELMKTAREEVRKEMVRQNINDLAACGVCLSQPHARYLPPEHKQELYARLAAELERMSEEGNRTLQQIPELQELKAHPKGWDEEKVPLLKRTLRKLAQKKCCVAELLQLSECVSIFMLWHIV